MSTKVYVDDVGVVFRAAIGTDVTAMVWGRIMVEKPTGDVMTWVAIVDPDDSTKIKYTSVAGDLDEIGLYRAQSYVKKGGWTLRGETDQFSVHAAFK